MMKLFNLNDGKNYYIVGEDMSQAYARYQEMLVNSTTDKPCKLTNISETGIPIEKSFCDSKPLSGLTNTLHEPQHVVTVDLEYEESSEEEMDIIRCESHFFISHDIDSVLKYVFGEYGHNHVRSISFYDGADDIVIY